MEKTIYIESAEEFPESIIVMPAWESDKRMPLRYIREPQMCEGDPKGGGLMESGNRTNVITLLPCPFCGGKASKRLFYGGKYGIYCDECSARVGGLYGTEAEAIAAWNTRAERTCKDATSEEHTQAFTCSECGCWVAYDEYWETGIYVQGDGQAVHIHPNYCPNCGAKVVS